MTGMGVSVGGRVAVGSVVPVADAAMAGWQAAVCTGGAVGENVDIKPYVGAAGAMAVDSTIVCDKRQAPRDPAVASPANLRKSLRLKLFFFMRQYSIDDVNQDITSDLLPLVTLW